MGQLEQARTQLRTILPRYYTTAVVRSIVTLSQSNIDGDETSAVSSTENINVYIARKARPWNFDKTGYIEGGDAIMLIDYQQAMSRGDLITWNGNTYQVQTVLDRDMLGGGVAYKTCNLFLK
jgi:hypothetical protein